MLMLPAGRAYHVSTGVQNKQPLKIQRHDQGPIQIYVNQMCLTCKKTLQLK